MVDLHDCTVTNENTGLRGTCRQTLWRQAKSSTVPCIIMRKQCVLEDSEGVGSHGSCTHPPFELKKNREKCKETKQIQKKGKERKYITYYLFDFHMNNMNELANFPKCLKLKKNIDPHLT